MSNSESVEKRKDLFEILAMHWEGLGKVFQSGEDFPIDNLESNAKVVNRMMKLVGFQEMFTIVKGLKREKTPGPDDIINEMLKYGGNRTVEVLCSFVYLVIESRNWPDCWRWSYIVPLFKAGVAEVALGSCVAKVMKRMLAGRLSKFSENHILTDGQGRFRPGRGCADQILVFRSVCDIMCYKGDRNIGHFWM